jgi:CheY-like chemotaxis protein
MLWPRLPILHGEQPPHPLPHCAMRSMTPSPASRSGTARIGPIVPAPGRPRPSSATDPVGERISSTLDAPAATAGVVAPASRGTVLVVDDERGVRTVVARALARAGFEVLQAGDGHTAVEIYAEAGGRIGCVLLDLTMPGIDGAETFRRLRRDDPAARVVITSGHDPRDVAGLFPDGELTGYLQKPCDLASLIRVATEASQGG